MTKQTPNRRRPPAPIVMTGDQFQSWRDRMIASGKATSFFDLACKLGVTENTITNLSRNGGDQRLALACAALMSDLKPYGAAA